MSTVRKKKKPMTLTEFAKRVKLMPDEEIRQRIVKLIAYRANLTDCINTLTVELETREGA